MNPTRERTGCAWDFRTGPWLTGVTGAEPELVPYGRLDWRPDPVVGGGLVLDGASHLAVPAAEVGPLNVARLGDEVSVVAQLRREATGIGFVAGMWQERDDDPRRQYGLFCSLPSYGGDQRVCGHVSADGRPSPGLPYSRDYSASARPVPIGEWVVVGFSYDGSVITSYLDGTSDRVPHYTEPGPPLGAGLSYAKNPYVYPAGLNRTTVSDFTVGAVRLSSGLGNFFTGTIARLLVVPRALTATQMSRLAQDWAGISD